MCLRELLKTSTHKTYHSKLAAANIAARGASTNSTPSSDAAPPSTTTPAGADAAGVDGDGDVDMGAKAETAAEAAETADATMQ